MSDRLGRQHLNSGDRSRSRGASAADERRYFCEEPWTGIFSVRADGDVICCPCYAQVKLGNINEASIAELWNSETIVRMRQSLAVGELPAECRGQLCPVVVGTAEA